MRYDKKQVMTRAQAEAKKTIENAAAYAIKKFENSMEITVDGVTRVLNRWTKGEYDRVYANGGSRRGECFVDLKNKRSNLKNTSYNVKIAEIVLAMEF